MTSKNTNVTAGIVDSHNKRYKKLNDDLVNSDFSVIFSLQDEALTFDILKNIDVDVLFVHINDMHVSANESLQSALSKLIIKYTGGSLPVLTQDEINSGKVFNIAYKVDHDGTVDGGKRKDFLTMDDCIEIKRFLRGEIKILSFVQGGSLVFQINRLHSQILAPLVFLHHGLQMEKKGIKVFSTMSDEGKDGCKKRCEEGIKLLKDTGQELKAKFRELLGLPATNSSNRIKSQPEKDLEEFIHRYRDKLNEIFNNLSVNNFAVPVDIDDLLTGIEHLSKIMEEGIACSETVKKIRVLRHDFYNVMRRLNNYTSPFSSKNRENLHSEIKDLHSKLIEFNTSEVYKYVQVDMSNELNEAAGLIKKLLGAATNPTSNDEYMLQLKDEIVDVLQKIIDMTLTVVPGQKTI